MTASTGAAGAIAPQLDPAAILAALDEDQAAICVATTNKDVLVNAGAGSGKTRLIISQIGYMLKLGLIQPTELMVITFTNKAATELKERMAAMIGPELASQMELIGTFHSVCIKLLRRFLRTDLGWGSFQILDEDDRARAIKTAMLALQMSPQDSDVSTASRLISLWKSNLVLPQQAMERMVHQQDHVGKQIAEIYAAYMGMCEKRLAMDFDDILLYTVLCLQRGGAMHRFMHNQIKRIVVDEFQDTNPVQLALCALAKGPNSNIMAIGDDRQGIYSFRGADIGNILDFRKAFPNAEIHTLGRNYRSQSVIVEAAEHLIRKNKEQLEKNCRAMAPRGELIRVIAAEDDGIEAERVAAKIDELFRRKDIDHSKMAILYRNNYLSRKMESSLLGHRIPYAIEGGVHFYGRKEVRDVLALLRAAINPRDDAAIIRLLSLREGVGEASLDAYTSHAAANGISLIDSLQSLRVRNSRAREQANFLVDWLTRMQVAAFAMPLPAFLEVACAQFGYIDILDRDCKTTEEKTMRRENVAELLRAAAEYQQVEPGIMAGMRLLDMAIQSENRTENTGVRLMTVHGSKGLEFDVVFLVGFSDDVFPSPRANIAEERRLAYVAMTRAKHRLFLTYPAVRYGRSVRPIGASSFMADIPPEFIRYE